jgi:hypothetical protein
VRIHNTTRLIAIAVVVALALLTTFLVIRAFRPQTVVGGGSVPEGIPTWGAEAPAGDRLSPSPTPTVLEPPRADLNLAFSDDGSAFRASRDDEACGSSSVRAEMSADGGVTWSPVTFGTEVNLAVVASAEWTATDQIDVVGGIAPDCSATLVTSFTGGQYWANYPDRVSEATYALAGTVHSLGQDEGSPCVDPKRAARADDLVLASCAEGTFGKLDGGEWALLNSSPSMDVTSAGVQGVYSVSTDDDVCPGSGNLLQLHTPVGGSVDSENIACLPVSGSAAVDATTSALWVWSGAQVFTSTDRGATWSPIAG